MRSRPFGRRRGGVAAVALAPVVAATAAAAALLLPVLPVGSVKPAAAAQDEAAGLPGYRVEKMAVVLADAPVRSALELVFTGARFDYSIENSVAGTIGSLDTRKDGALPAIDLLTRMSGPGGFTWSRNGEGVYRVLPMGGAAPRPAAPAVAPAAGEAAKRPTRGARDVPRRVCGVLFGGNGAPVSAILETGVPGPGASIDIVDRGDRVADGSGGRGVGAGVLTVSEVRRDGVYLTDSRGRRIVVPLRRIEAVASSAKPSQDAKP